VQPHEKLYPEIAKAMGIDPLTKKYVPWEIENLKFFNNFQDIVLKPILDIGTTFWW
jgi:hypothetical protein